MSIIRKIRVGNIGVEIEEAPDITFPTHADCNSPLWWDSSGRLNLLTSTGHPRYSSGPSLDQLQFGGEVTFTAWRDGGLWIESVYPQPDGAIYGWYHNEPAHFISDEYQQGRQFPMTAPFIGAAVSNDNGRTWDDLGLVLSGGEDTLDLEHRNEWFAGGNGDFTVILDRQQEYFYFLISTYYKDATQQGISLARMRFVDRFCPVGKVQKWYRGKWEEPGLCGQVSPVLPAHSGWYTSAPDVFWGPSVHWNTALNQYVILMNHACTPNWKQEGIYISFSPDLSDPRSWTKPVKILEDSGWYPQVIGIKTAQRETDREAGAVSRLFIHGKSQYNLCLSLL